MTEAMPYRWQFCGGGYETNEEDTADEVRAWAGAHGDICIVAVRRTPRGRWRIDASDLCPPVSAYNRRFPEPIDAVAYMGRRARAVVVEAVCRCGTPGAECD